MDKHERRGFGTSTARSTLRTMQHRHFGNGASSSRSIRELTRREKYFHHDRRPFIVECAEPIVGCANVRRMWLQERSANADAAPAAFRWKVVTHDRQRTSVSAILAGIRSSVKATHHL